MIAAPLLLLASLVGITANAQSKVHTIDVWPAKPTVEIQPTMWGIFFEDINFAADGGLYAELVKNRSFEFADPKMGWKMAGNGAVLINNRLPANNQNPRYASVSVKEGSYTITNEGFRGMGISANEQYNFSILAKATAGAVSLTVQLQNAKGENMGQAILPAIGGQWKKYTVSIKAQQTDPAAKLQLNFQGKGIVDIDMVSLFPEDTWKKRPGGLRKDLVEKLADLKPGFLRFPGGCIVEGRDLLNRYQWKTTVGTTENRKLIINRWNTEFSSKLTPDYFQSYGLGFFEYFQLAEDIGAQPLPIINCGMACQYNSAEVVSLPQLDPYIQDALDLIEFANGPVTSKWGKLRAAMGHPKSFGLKMIGVGNEQWGEQYLERYKLFEKILKQKYPSIKLVAAAGPSPKGKDFEFAWQEFPKTKVDLIDEHYYQSPSWFLNNANRYDKYDRKGPKIFAGEYASHDKEGKEAESRNTWLSALTEAAFMTGLERNADVVNMCAYAPLLAHVNAWQWRPDLIWFDNLTSVATPNYWVQQMYAVNKGTQVLPILENEQIISGQDSLYAAASIDKNKKVVIIKLVNAGGEAKKTNINLHNLPGIAAGGESIVLQNDDLRSFNGIGEGEKVSPIKKPVTISGNSIPVSLSPYSFVVIIIKYQ